MEPCTETLSKRIGNILCLQINADTLTNKLNEFELIVKDSNPDIIGICEVLPKCHTRKIFPEEFKIKGYNEVVHENISNNKGRGSIMYIREGLDYKEIKIKPKKGKFEEGIFIEVNVNEKEKLFCANIYRRGESTVENNNNLLEIMRKIAKCKIAKSKYNHTVIMGDFNLNDIDWVNITSSAIDPDNYSNKFIECYRDCFYTQHVTENTRQRGQDKPSCLDLVFTNSEYLIDSVEQIAPLGKSDHSILKFELKIKTEPPKPKISVKYEKGDYGKINEILSQVDWLEEFSKYPDNVEKQWEFFKLKYNEAERMYVPRKKVYIGGKLNKKFTIALDRSNLKKIKKKNRLWGRIRKNLAHEEEKLQYKKLNNQIRRLTRKGKKLMEKQIAINSKKNPKAFWKYAQSKLKSKSSIPDIMKNDDESNPIYASKDRDKSDIFLDYFSSVFTEEPPGEDMPSFEQRDYETELSNIEITVEKVMLKLKNLKVNKSPGPDCIHPRVLHEISPAISIPLTELFKTSLKTRSLPEEWKHANISAIFKKGKKTTPKNYRPVSLTSVICKIMESLIRDEVIDHMNENKLFSNKQFGFLAGRSTVLQLLKVMDIWTQILDQGGSINVI